MLDDERHSEANVASNAQQRLRDQIRKLVLMKETGPKSAAWHRARVDTIWRLHQQLSQTEIVHPKDHQQST
jgi:hypothetical protein